MMTDTLMIPPPISGFPGIALGGYVAGRLAASWPDRPVQVDFRRPIRIGQTYRIEPSEQDGRALVDGGGPLAVARPCQIELDVPPVPAWSEAEAASLKRQARGQSGQTSCFGCGVPEAGEGLKQLIDRVSHRDLVAAAWIPAPALADPENNLPPEFVWAALDCPAGWACRLSSDGPPDLVTAQLAAQLLRPIHTGQPHISFGWVIGRERRKYFAGSALALPDGTLCAISRSLWVAASSAGAGGRSAAPLANEQTS